MFNQLTTPYNPGIDAFFDFWEPEASTLHWTKAEASIGGGTGGSFFGMGPIAAIKAAGIPVPASKIAAFAERMRHNFIDRGILNPEIFAPNFDALSPLPNLYEAALQHWPAARPSRCRVQVGRPIPFAHPSQQREQPAFLLREPWKEPRMEGR